MIIDCIKCNKKFNVDSSLIPDKGRLLECGSCNNKWFFEKDIIKKTSSSIEKSLTINDNADTDIKIASDTSNIQDNENVKDLDTSDQVVKDKNLKKNKKFNILNLTIVFIISFIALIIILDTFKSPLEKIFPNIEFLLYNLYESIKDIELFFKDLT
jgi:predicted Zn finger-like uncharacterized protein|tara:strand:- start:15119 stop:15586 length:468 start_codon:yes stop_codon:yes gene_type:complete